MFSGQPKCPNGKKLWVAHRAKNIAAAVKAAARAPGPGTGFIVGILGSRRVGLTSIDLVIMEVQVVWGWFSKFIEAVPLLSHFLWCNFHEGDVITVVVIGDLVGIIVRVLRNGCDGLTSIVLGIIVLVGKDSFSKSIKAVAPLQGPLLSHLLWCRREGSPQFATGATNPPDGKPPAPLSSHGSGKKAQMNLELKLSLNGYGMVQIRGLR